MKKYSAVRINKIGYNIPVKFQKSILSLDFQFCYIDHTNKTGV
jgi:hypothetical protein